MYEPAIVSSHVFVYIFLLVAKYLLVCSAIRNRRRSRWSHVRLPAAVLTRNSRIIIVSSRLLSARAFSTRGGPGRRRSRYTYKVANRREIAARRAANRGARVSYIIDTPRLLLSLSLTIARTIVHRSLVVVVRFASEFSPQNRLPSSRSGYCAARISSRSRPLKIECLAHFARLASIHHRHAIRAVKVDREQQRARLLGRYCCC